MKIIGLERVVIGVKDLDAAIARFTDIFGIEFVKTAPLRDNGDIVVKRTVTEHVSPEMENFVRSPAFSTGGIELLATDPAVEKEGIRSFGYRVENLEDAMAEMVARGIRMTEYLEIGGVKEAIYKPEDTQVAELVFLANSLALIYAV